MEIGTLEVTIKNNLDEYIQLIKRVNDFELEVEVAQEKE